MRDPTIIAGVDTMFDRMSGFYREGANGELTADGVPLTMVAREVGTPVHVYSATILSDRYRQLDSVFAGYPHRLHYAIKANATLALVRHLRELGARADANSLGEIEVAKRAGFLPSDIVFTGVGKTTDELECAVATGLHAINVESPGELSRIAAAARRLGRQARLAIRLNPNIDAETHPRITTGLFDTKFGVTLDDARVMIRHAMAEPSLCVVGLHAHVGSQITRTAPLERVSSTLAHFATELRAQGVPLEHLDLGGGLGVAYAPDQPVVSVAAYADAILPAVRATGLTLLLEPGRWLVAPAGVLMTTVVDVKRKAGGGWFVVVDAGMTDLLRPALYGAWHDVEPVRRHAGETMLADIVGPVCETSDTLATERQLPAVDVGDRLVIRDTGAYGAAMASNYNRRPMAAEVLVHDRRYTVVRRRQSIDDMLRWDT